MLNRAVWSRKPVTVLALLGLVSTCSAEVVHGDQRRTVEQTFAFFGCNRIDYKDWLETKSTNPSSASIPQLRQNMADIAKLKPNVTFFGGDLVMGYADDHGQTLKGQLEAWAQLIHQMPSAFGTELVAIAGNHELNRKAGEKKLPLLPADAIWTKWVKTQKLIPADAKGPEIRFTQSDHLATDQSALNFSFRRGPVQFVVLNTDTRVSHIDPKTGETRIAEIPVHWLASELDRAERDPNVKCTVVLGHRNLVDPKGVKGDSPVTPESAAEAVRALKSHAKVLAYVCAHVHGFDISRIDETEIRQVVFGNGGSPLEPDWKPKGGRTFGFGYFKVYSDGSLGVVPYFRPEPKNYLDDRPGKVPAARRQRELVIKPRSA